MESTNTPLRRVGALSPIWLLWLAVMGLALLAGVSLLRYGQIYTGPHWGLRGAPLLPALFYATVGALILARHPHHRVGWLALAGGVGAVLQTALEEYATYGLVVVPGALPGALFVAWVCNWVWVPVNGALLGLLPLYFPAGLLPSPRWRWAALLILLSMVVMVVGFGVTPGPFGSMLGLFDNPYGLTAFGERSAEVASWITVVGMLGFFAGVVLAVASLLWRLRHAQGVQRLQLKWFVYAAALAGIMAPVTATDIPVLHMVFLVCESALPVAIGLAVLRYRLYDIDLLVNRTLVYAALTAILAGVYFGSVALLGGLLSTISGGNQSSLVTVLATLTIAALFTPLRRRVQAFIDQRFYRRKYDAARTLAGFGATARDDVDLSTLNERLLAVVKDTMQPAHVGLWVRGPDEPAA